jgi:ribosomal protein S18 acetylase RimI-like enzyme
MDIEFVIRPGVPADVEAVAKLLYNSAVDQGSPGSLCVDAASLLRDGFGEQPRFFLLVAEADKRLVGLGLYFFNYSTWASTNGLYLEDLYVEPEFRRRGVARALVRQLARIAAENGCGRFQWLVLRSNQGAIRFYESLGAKVAEGWALMQMYGEDIKRMGAD